MQITLISSATQFSLSSTAHQHRAFKTISAAACPGHSALSVNMGTTLRMVFGRLSTTHHLLNSPILLALCAAQRSDVSLTPHQTSGKLKVAHLPLTAPTPQA